MLKEEDIDMVRSSVNMPMITNYFGIERNRKGFAMCPFHNDNHPSMKIYDGYYDNDGYYCFSCGANGDIIKFVMLYGNVEFEEAVRMIATIFHIPISDSKIEVSEREVEEIKKKKKEFGAKKQREMERKKRLREISEKIQCYEFLKNQVNPIGDISSFLCSKILILSQEWEELFGEKR